MSRRKPTKKSAPPGRPALRRTLTKEQADRIERELMRGRHLFEEADRRDAEAIQEALDMIYKEEPK